MNELYTNHLGKIRPLTEDAPQQSQKRRDWFADFKKRLMLRLPKELQAATFQIIGSVCTNAADEGSDIDIIIRNTGSDSTAEAIIRNEIVTLLKEMKESNQETYELDIQDVGSPPMFSAVLQFRRENF